MGLFIDRRSGWKAAPKRVIVPYLTFVNTLEVPQVLPGTGNSVGIWPDHGLSLNTKV